MGKYFTNETNKLKNLHEGHRKRLRNRINSMPWQDLEEYVLMEYLITIAHKRDDTNVIAHRLIDEFGSIANVCEAPVENLKKIQGVGEVTATFLHSLPKLLSIYKGSKIKERPVLSTPSQVFQFFGKTFNHMPNEELHLILLDMNSKLISTKIIARGDANSVGFKLCDIPQQAVLVGAKLAILIHNHPDSNPTPSDEDIQVTYQLYSSLSSCGVTLIEHLIVCQDDDNYYSFSLNGILSQFSKILNENLTKKVDIKVCPPKLD